MMVQLTKCVVCGSDLQRENSGDGCLSSSILFKYELGQGMTGCSGECCFGVIYGEWYGVCDFIVLSVVETCVDYGGVNVFHDCLDFIIVVNRVIKPSFFP